MPPPKNFSFVKLYDRSNGGDFAGIKMPDGGEANKFKPEFGGFHIAFHMNVRRLLAVGRPKVSRTTIGIRL
jgi:hypothetical protein